MTKITLFKTLFLALALFVSNVAWGAVNITPIRTDVTGFTTWTDVDVAGTTYVQLLKETSSTISPAMNFDNYSNETLDFKARSYGGTSTVENEVFVAISTNNGTSWTEIGSRTPSTNSLTSVAQFDLSTYSGTQVLIKFYSKGTSATVGVGIDDITIKGVEQTNKVSTPTISASGALNTTDNYFNTASITLSSATDGASIYYTTNGASPTASSTLYSIPFDITSTTTIKAMALKTGLDNSEIAEKTITISAALAPTITVTEVTASEMSTLIGSTDSEILTVSGAKLTANITVSIDGADAAMFSVTPETISQNAGVASGSVTVTYNPTAPGSHTANLRYNSTGATEVIRTLNGTSTMVTLVATDATDISISGFTANWNAVAGASEYELSVYTKSSGASNAPSSILTENFDGFSAGSANGSANSTDVSTSLDTYTKITGWTGSKVYQAGGTVKMGSSGSLGYISTPALNLSGSNLTLSFKTMAWAGDATEIKIYLDDALLYTATGLNNTDYTLTPFSAALTGGSATSKIKFEGNIAAKGRFFIEDVIISGSGNSSTSTPIAGSPFTVTGSTSKAIIELDEYTTYYYNVIAKNGSSVIATSNEVSVTTLNSTDLQNVTNNLKLRSINGNIIFNTFAGKMVTVYNSLGQRILNAVTSDGINTIKANVKGVVFVKIGSEISKLIVE